MPTQRIGPTRIINTPRIIDMQRVVTVIRRTNGTEGVGIVAAGVVGDYALFKSDTQPGVQP